MTEPERGRPAGVDDGLIEVEVAYATPRQQLIISLRLPRGATVAEAIELSGIRLRFPEIGPDSPVGIFSRKVPPDQRLSPGDRVEVYRPLIADPKEIRRERAEKDRRRRE